MAPQTGNLADFWWFEHLLTVADIPDEFVNYFGKQFPDREGGSMPASCSARLFVRYLRNCTHGDHMELLEVLGFLEALSLIRNEFRTEAAAAGVKPPVQLLVQVLLQVLINSVRDSCQQELPADAYDIQQHVEQVLQQAALTHIKTHQELTQCVSDLQQLLSNECTNGELLQQLDNNFPPDVVQQLLQQYTAAAWAALGKTSLQMYQQAVESGSSWPPPDPFMVFLYGNQRQRHQQQQLQLWQPPSQLQLASADHTAAAAGIAQQRAADTQQLRANDAIIPATEDDVISPGGPGSEFLIAGNAIQSTAAALDGSADAAAGSAPMSSTPGIPSPGTGCDEAAVAAVLAGEKPRHQRRAGDAAAATVRLQLNLGPSNAAAAVAAGAAHQPQQCQTQNDRQANGLPAIKQDRDMHDADQSLGQQGSQQQASDFQQSQQADQLVPNLLLGSQLDGSGLAAAMLTAQGSQLAPAAQPNDASVPAADAAVLQWFTTVADGSQLASQGALVPAVPAGISCSPAVYMELDGNHPGLAAILYAAANAADAGTGAAGQAAAARGVAPGEALPAAQTASAGEAAPPADGALAAAAANRSLRGRACSNALRWGPDRRRRIVELKRQEQDIRWQRQEKERLADEAAKQQREQKELARQQEQEHEKADKERQKAEAKRQQKAKWREKEKAKLAKQQEREQQRRAAQQKKEAKDAEQAKGRAYVADVKEQQAAEVAAQGEVVSTVGDDADTESPAVQALKDELLGASASSSSSSDGCSNNNSSNNGWNSETCGAAEGSSNEGTDNDSSISADEGVGRFEDDVGQDLWDVGVQGRKLRRHGLQQDNGLRLQQRGQQKQQQCSWCEQGVIEGYDSDRHHDAGHNRKRDRSMRLLAAGAADGDGESSDDDDPVAAGNGARAAKHRKLCGAAGRGRGRTLQWSSPSAEAVDSPEDDLDADRVAYRNTLQAARAAAAGAAKLILERRKTRATAVQPPSPNQAGMAGRHHAAAGAGSPATAAAAGRQLIAAGRSPAARSGVAARQRGASPLSRSGSAGASSGSVQAARAAARAAAAPQRSGAAASVADREHSIIAIGKQRRKTVKWTNEEVALLKRLVKQEGFGNWTVMLEIGKEAGIFHDLRISVDLKDKWRNMQKFGHV